MADALHSQLDLFGGLYLWADFESPKALHKDRLDDSLQITVALPDTFQGLPRLQRVQCRVKEHATQDGWASGGIDRMPAAPNSEVTLSDLMAGQDITGWPAQGRLYDLDNSIAYLTFDGVVAELDAGSGDLTIENLDLSVLNQDVPRRRLVDLFPALDLSTSSVTDPRVIKCFAEMRQVRLTKLFSTTGAHGYGAICTPATIATVYRGRRVAPTAEYQVVQVRPGLLAVVFSRLPVDTTGRELEIHVDIVSTAFATHADCGEWVLTDTLDGLGQRINPTSFTVAAAAYTTAAYLPGGGIGPEPVKAQTLLNDLALRGTVIQLDNLGRWTWTVDAPALHTAAQYNGLPFGLGRGDGQWENIARVSSYKHKRLDERSKSYTMQSLWSGGFGQGSYLLTATATRAGVTGVDMPPVTNLYIGDMATLRRETGYRLSRLAAAEQSITLDVINEARIVTLNSLVPITVPSKRLDTSNPSLPWQCVKITGQRDNWTLEFAGYNSAQYSTTAASFTTAPGASVLTDFTYTNPDAPTGFAVVATEFVTGTDGTKQVLATLQATGPADNVNQMVFQVFKPGATFPQQQRIVRCPVNNTTVSVVMRLTLGQTYDLQAFARNTNNADEFQDGTVALILGHPAGTDTTQPSGPTLIEAVAYNQRSIMVNWAPNTESDLNEYGVYRQAMTNLVQNHSFEKMNFENWTVTGAPAGGEAIEQNISAGHTGAYGLRVVALTTNFLIQQAIAVTNGATYTFAGWMQIRATTGGTAFVRVNRGDGVFVNALVETDATQGTWKFGYVTFVAQGATATIECRINPTASMTVWFDDLILVAGTPNPTVKIGEVRADIYTDTGAFATDTAYWYAITAFDRSENQSPKSNLMAAVPVRIPDEDLPNEIPLSLGTLSFLSSGTYQSSDGTTLAFIRVVWTNPADTKRVYIEVAYRRNGNTQSYLIGDQVTGTTSIIDDLTPGVGYDFRVRGVSRTGQFGPASTLTNQIAPGDTTPPATVSGVSASVGTGKAIDISWTASAAGDLAEYIIYRGTSVNPTAEYRRSRTNSFTDTFVNYDTTYHYRIKAVDHTGNASVNFSSNVSGLVKKVLTDDVDDDQITSPKRQNLNTIGPSAINVAINSQFVFLTGSASANNAFQWGIKNMEFSNLWNEFEPAGLNGTRLGLIMRPTNTVGYEVRLWNGKRTTWATDYVIAYW